MRVALGLALGESGSERVDRALEFYELLSTFAFCSSTPTLFNAGTRHPQLSSCFLTTIPDDLGGIFKSIRDDASSRSGVVGLVTIGPQSALSVAISGGRMVRARV